MMVADINALGPFVKVWVLDKSKILLVTTFERNGSWCGAGMSCLVHVLKNLCDSLR